MDDTTVEAMFLNEHEALALAYQLVVQSRNYASAAGIDPDDLLERAT